MKEAISRNYSILTHLTYVALVTVLISLSSYVLTLAAQQFDEGALLWAFYLGYGLFTVYLVKKLYDIQEVLELRSYATHSKAETIGIKLFTIPFMFMTLLDALFILLPASISLTIAAYLLEPSMSNEFGFSYILAHITTPLAFAAGGVRFLDWLMTKRLKIRLLEAIDSAKQ